MSAKIPIDQPSRLEASYALGWGRIQLPGKMGHFGLNPDLMPDGMPVVGRGVPSQLVIFHQGSLPGALSVVILLPDTESAIVISTNALALNGVPDRVGQLVLEECLAIPLSNRRGTTLSKPLRYPPPEFKVISGTYSEAGTSAKEWNVAQESGELRWDILG